MSEQAAARLHALVHGRVQGVNFRSFVYTRARALDLTGYVRNPEGGRTVEVVAEGALLDLEQLLEYLREGPRLARVDGVDAEWSERTGDYPQFAMVE